MVEERKLFEDGRCLIRRDPKMFKLAESKNVFLFGEAKAAGLFFAALEIFDALHNKIWLKKKGWYSYPLTIYFRREKQEIGRQVLQTTESGLWVRCYDCIENLGLANCRTRRISVFESLKEYIADYSTFANLVFDNFRYIFYLHFLVCLFTFVAFAVHHLIKFTRKRAISISALLELCVNRIFFWANAVRQFLIELSQFFNLAL